MSVEVPVVRCSSGQGRMKGVVTFRLMRAPAEVDSEGSKLVRNPLTVL